MELLDEHIPDALPLVDALLDERLGRSGQLSDTTALLIQHQLGSIVPMTRALLSLGLDPGRVHWVDIPYSGNARVVSRLVELGIPRANFAPADYHLERPYTRYQHGRVSRLVRTLLDGAAPEDRLLVLDDGAYFVQAASCFAAGFPRLAVVEQTRRGVEILRGNRAASAYASRIPVVNVAEAPPKLAIESGFIGDCVADALLAQVEERLAFIRHGPVLLLGFGAIGSAVAEALVQTAGIPRSRIHVLDPDAGARERAHRAGFADGSGARSSDPRYRLVVGCSGTTSFGVGDRTSLEDGAVLASASSGSAELSREGFVELADTHEEDDIAIHDRASLPTRPIHSAIGIRLVDRDVSFLNGGFPINFDGRVNCVPFGRIQLTRALMVAGAVQANQAFAGGIQPLDVDTCDWIVRRYGALTGEPIPAAALARRAAAVVPDS